MHVNSEGQRLGKTKRRRWEWLLIVALVALVVQGVRMHRMAELAKQQEAQKKAEQVYNNLSEPTKEMISSFTFGLVEGAKGGLVNPLEVAMRNEVRILTDRLKQDPDNIDLLKRRAYDFHQLHEDEGEFDDLDRILELNPDSAFALGGRASLYEKFGEWQLALQDTEHFLKLKPDDSQMLNNQAWCLAKLGRFEESVKWVKQSLALRKHPFTLDTLGYAYVGLGEYQKAVDAYSQALDMAPQQLASLRGRAVAYRCLGKKELSQKDLDTQIAIDPDYCLHWALETDPGDHHSNDKTVLGSDSPAGDTRE